MTVSLSNEQPINNSFLNLIMLSQDDGNIQNSSSGIASLTTVSSSTSANKFLISDTYEIYRVHRHQLILQSMTEKETISIIKEEEEEKEKEKFIINESEMNSTCCIIMIDMTLQCVKLFFHLILLFLFFD